MSRWVVLLLCFHLQGCGELSGEQIEGKEAGRQELSGKQLEGQETVLHFMFLARDSVGHASVWRDFFSAAPPGSWKGWLHCVNTEACRQSEILLIPGIQMVPTVQTRYCRDLISAEVQLLKVALNGSVQSEFQKFILVSDSTLPVKPFAEVRRVLSKGNQSDICMYPRTWGHRSRVLFGQDMGMIVHHQWFVLNLPDAQALVEAFHPWNDAFWPIWFNWKVPLHPYWVRNAAGERDVADGWGIRSCQDETVVFADIFGLINLSLPEVTVERFGTFSLRSDLDEGRCRTFILWNLTIAEGDPFLRSIAHDSESEYLKPDPKGSIYSKTHTGPAKWTKVGESLAAKMRSSKFLFMRKVDPNASMPNFAKIVFSQQFSRDGRGTSHLM